MFGYKKLGHFIMLRRQDSDLSDFSMSSEEDRRPRRRHEVGSDEEHEGDRQPEQSGTVAGSSENDGILSGDIFLKNLAVLPTPGTPEAVPAGADPSLLIMKGVDRTVTGAHLRNLFEHFGVSLTTSKRVVDPTHNIPREEVVLKFGSAEDAQRAFFHMHGGCINGRGVLLSYFTLPAAPSS